LLLRRRVRMGRYLISDRRGRSGVTLASARTGDDAAFRLHLPLTCQPALLRYLRLITAEPEECGPARPGFQVVTGLRRFPRRGAGFPGLACSPSPGTGRLTPAGHGTAVPAVPLDLTDAAQQQLTAPRHRRPGPGGRYPRRLPWISSSRWPREAGRDHHAAGGGRAGYRGRGQDLGQDPRGGPSVRRNRGFAAGWPARFAQTGV